MNRPTAKQEAAFQKKAQAAIAGNGGVTMAAMIGVVDFVNPVTGAVMDTSPVYQGENPYGEAVAVRADRAFNLLRDPLRGPHGSIWACHRRFRPARLN